MLSKELLLEKGFKLYTYPEGKYFEFVTKDDAIMEKILDKDYMGDEETIILQLKDDLTEMVLSVDTDNYDLSNDEFDNILERL